MKRAIAVFGLFWLMTLQTISAPKQMTYEITYASNSVDLWEIKNEVISTFNDIIGYVNEAYYDELIQSSVSEFEHINDSQVSFANRKLSLVIGDGKGIKIQGSFNPTCQIEIKKKSFLLELFQK